MFCQLARKKDLVKQFHINPCTFEVSFENFNGEIFPKRRLSAGEKTVYATSLVWALAQASHRPLPMVIDTPLGRLDTKHRLNLIKNFFPYANRQVILLSTDTEINGKYKKLIEDKIAKKYLIVDEVNKKSGDRVSKIVSGYFTGGNINEF